MGDDLTVRRATTEDMMEDMMAGDTWGLRRLQVDCGGAIEAATALWGPPGTSVMPGEMLWRLRVDEATPVYLSICLDEEEPIVMFNVHCRPDRAVEERILDLLGEMLVHDDADAV